MNPCELSSSALAHLLKGSTCCAFRDTLDFNKWLFELGIFSYQLKAVCPFFYGVSNKLTECNVVSKGKVIKHLILRNCLTETRYWLIWVSKWQCSNGCQTSFVPEMQCMHGLSHRSSVGAYTNISSPSIQERICELLAVAGALGEKVPIQLPIILNLSCTSAFTNFKLKAPLQRDYQWGLFPLHVFLR